MIDRMSTRRGLARLALGLALGLALAGPARARAAGSYADVLPRVRALRAQGRVPIAVFDLDGTLLDSAPRTRNILSAALEGPGAMVTPEQPALAESVRSLPLAISPICSTQMSTHEARFSSRVPTYTPTRPVSLY